MPSEILVIKAMLVIFVGIPFALLLIKILRGDFWPAHLYAQYKEGKHDISDSDDK